jgi:hypothetical protein
MRGNLAFPPFRTPRSALYTWKQGEFTLSPTLSIPSHFSRNDSFSLLTQRRQDAKTQGDWALGRRYSAVTET